ncbi:MAG: hypothetical protein ACXVAX_05640 [Pseudobdellovibrio sp.]
MNYKVKCIFLIFSIFACGVSNAKIYNHDQAISGFIAVMNNKKINYETRIENYVEDGIEYRTDRKTAWKAVLKTKDDKVIDSFYLILKRVDRPISSSLGSNNSNKPEYSEYEAKFYFLYVPESYKVEYYYKNVLKKTDLIKPPN